MIWMFYFKSKQYYIYFSLGEGSGLASAVSIWGGPLCWVISRPAPVAVTSIALIVIWGGARVSVDVVAWGRRSWGWGWGRGSTTSLDLDIIEVEVLVVAVASLASVFPEPVVIGSPVGNSEGHVSSNVSRHLSVRSTVSVHGDSVSSLSQSDLEVRELSSVLVEVNLDVEVLFSVDFVVGSWTVVIVANSVNGVLPAWASSVAVVVVADRWWGIARVRGSLESILVSFHDIEFRAIDTSNLVGITVVVSIRFIVVSWWVLAGHSHKVEGSDASTVSCCKVNVILNWTSQKVRSVELSGVQGRWFRQIASSIEWNGKSWSTWCFLLHGNIESLGLSVFFNGYSGIGVSFWGQKYHCSSSKECFHLLMFLDNREN